MNINNLTKVQQDRLLNALNTYFDNTDQDERFDSFDQLKNRYPDGYINLAYTTYGEDDQFDIQVNFNLNKMRYEEWINLALYFKSNEVYDRTFDDFCDEIESCDFDSMISNCVMECSDREDNPERMFQILNDRLHKENEKDEADKEYRKILWYYQHENISIYDLVDYEGEYNKEKLDQYYKEHDEPTSKMWTEDLLMNEIPKADIGQIGEFVAGLNKKNKEKDNVKAKGL